MSKSRIAMAAIAVAVIMLGALPQRSAQAGFRLRIGGPVGVARMAVGHVLGLAGLHRLRMAARHGRIRTAALQPQNLGAAAEAMRPTVRAQLTAAAALSGWHGGRSANGWWRHADGTYGWVGPLFWPFAADDLAVSIMLGDGGALSTYGYPDIYAAIFAPYGPSELAAYMPAGSSGRRSRKIPDVAELCGSEAGAKPALPVDRIEQAVQPNEAQHAGLDELMAAWSSVAETIRASCPAERPATGLDRLAAMQARLAAMIKAVEMVQPSLSKFYGMLDDDQKARFNALAKDRRAAATVSARRDAEAASCQAGQEPRDDMAAQRQYEQLVKQQWPVGDIAASLRLDDTGRAALEVVQDTTMATMETLNACPKTAPLTAPARLAAAQTQLNAMLQAVKGVSDALDDFYFNLSDEQKTQFEAIGPKRGV
jgi:hypothetical protein